MCYMLKNLNNTTTPGQFTDSFMSCQITLGSLRLSSARPVITCDHLSQDE